MRGTEEPLAQPGQRAAEPGLPTNALRLPESSEATPAGAPRPGPRPADRSPRGHLGEKEGVPAELRAPRPPPSSQGEVPAPAPGVTASDDVSLETRSRHRAVRRARQGADPPGPGRPRCLDAKTFHCLCPPSCPPPSRGPPCLLSARGVNATFPATSAMPPPPPLGHQADHPHAVGRLIPQGSAQASSPSLPGPRGGARQRKGAEPAGLDPRPGFALDRSVTLGKFLPLPFPPP